MKKLLFFLVLGIAFTTLKAQCLEDRHSTNWYDGWISCSTSPNPKSSYGNTHWIKYDLGYTYTIFQTKFWNSNDPAHLDYGIMDYTVDYSVDGNNWINLGNFTANQASGLSTYQGDSGPDFNGVTARYILITPISNYGGSCYGFSEMYFNLNNSLDVTDLDLKSSFTLASYPNPFSDKIHLIINTSNQNVIQYLIFDMLGRKITQDKLEEVSSINHIEIDTKNLSEGIYLIQVLQGNNKGSLKIVKK